MSLFQGLSPRARIALMSGGLVALLAAEGAVLAYLTVHPPVPGSITTSGSAPAQQKSNAQQNERAQQNGSAPQNPNAQGNQSAPTGAPAPQVFTAPGVVPPALGTGAPQTTPGATHPNPAPGLASLAPPPANAGASPANSLAGASLPAPPASLPSGNARGASVSPVPPARGVIGSPVDTKRARAATLFAQAAALAKAGQTKAALGLWQQVAVLAPDDLATQQNLALLLTPTDPKKALVHARAATRLAPGDPRAQFQLARVLLTLGQPKDALAPLRATVKLAPKERDGHALLARVLVDVRQPRAAYDQWVALAQSNKGDLEANLAAATLAGEVLGRPDDAQKWLRRAQEANPRDPNAPLGLARLAMARRNPKEAAAILGRATQTAPDAFELYPALADARVAANNPKGALSALQSALARLPKTGGPAQIAAVQNTEGRLRLTMGRLLGDQKQPRAARDQFALAAKLLPRAVEPRALGALAETQLGDLSSATSLLQNAVALDPKNPTTRLLLAQTLAQSKRWREADGAFERYAAFSPRDPQALMQWASVAFQLKDGAKETRALTQVAALDAKNPVVWARLGAAQMRLGRKREAIRSFQTLAKISPRDLSAPLQVASLQSETGDAGGAFGTLRTALSARPDYAPVYQLLLQAGDAAGKRDEARAFAARQLALQAENGAALSQTLAFYDAKKRPAEARTLLGEVLARNPKASLAKNALASYNTREASNPKTASAKVP